VSDTPLRSYGRRDDNDGHAGWLAGRRMQPGTLGDDLEDPRLSRMYASMVARNFGGLW